MDRKNTFRKRKTKNNNNSSNKNDYNNENDNLIFFIFNSLLLFCSIFAHITNSSLNMIKDDIIRTDSIKVKNLAMVSMV